MTSKRINQRFAVRRVRRALNTAEAPPTQVGNRKMVRIRWGAGPDKNRGVDGMSDPDIYDYDYEFYFGEEARDCCDCCDFCPLHVDADAGEGWSYGAANYRNPPKLGDLFAA